MYAKAISYLLIQSRVTTEELFTFLKEQKMLTLLPLIISEVKERKVELEKRDTIFIESPFTLYDKNILVIKELIGGDKDAKVKLKEEKELLSGFRATYKDHRYDTSARAIINDLIK
jgi:F0F1-type ATP synthase delta subunit